MGRDEAGAQGDQHQGNSRAGKDDRIARACRSTRPRTFAESAPSAILRPNSRVRVDQPTRFPQGQGAQQRLVEDRKDGRVRADADGDR